MRIAVRGSVAYFTVHRETHGMSPPDDHEAHGEN
jgi:hypothetical protein